MRQVKAYEYDGKLYKTPEEALRQELYDDLKYLFANEGWQDIVNKITHNKDVQNQLVKLITRHQEEINGED